MTVRFVERPTSLGYATMLSPGAPGMVMLIPRTVLRPHQVVDGRDVGEPSVLFMHPDAIENLKTQLAFDDWMKHLETEIAESLDYRRRCARFDLDWFTRHRLEAPCG